MQNVHALLAIDQSFNVLVDLVSCDKTVLELRAESPETKIRFLNG